MRRTRRGSALTIGITFFFLAGLSAAGVASFSSRSHYRHRDPPPPAAGAVVLAARLGLAPESLAAADVSTAQVHVSAAAARDYWTVNGNTLIQKDNAVMALDQTIKDLQAAIAAGHAPATAQNDLATALSQRQSAASERDTMISDAFNAVTANLTADQISTMQTVQRNRSWHLPTHMLVVDRTPTEWIALQRAGLPTIDVHNPRFPSPSDPSPLSTSTVWSNASANDTVSTAAQRIAANGAAVETAWKAELMPTP